MLTTTCGQCLFWKSEDGEKGSCYRATNTTKVSGCGTGEPIERARIIANAIVERMIKDDETLAKMVDLVVAKLASLPETPKPSPKPSEEPESWMA